MFSTCTCFAFLYHDETWWKFRAGTLCEDTKKLLQKSLGSQKSRVFSPWKSHKIEQLELRLVVSLQLDDDKHIGLSETAGCPDFLNEEKTWSAMKFWGKPHIFTLLRLLLWDYMGLAESKFRSASTPWYLTTVIDNLPYSINDIIYIYMFDIYIYIYIW